MSDEQAPDFIWDTSEISRNQAKWLVTSGACDTEEVEASKNLSTEGLSDLRLARRLIDEELIARLDFSRAQTANDRDA